MAASISNAIAIATCDLQVDTIDTGAGTAVLSVYDGTPPANVDTALSGNTLLAELNLSNPAFGAAADITPGARATANSITDDSSANASGTPTFYRVANRNGDDCMQDTAGVGSGALNFGAAIVAGQPVSITSWTWTVLEA